MSEERRIKIGDLYHDPNTDVLLEIVTFNLTHYGTISEYKVQGYFEESLDTQIFSRRERVVPVCNEVISEDNFISNCIDDLGNSHYYCAAWVTPDGQVRSSSINAMLNKADLVESDYTTGYAGPFSFTPIKKHQYILFFETKEKWKKFEKWYWAREWSSGLGYKFFLPSTEGRVEDRILAILEWKRDISKMEGSEEDVKALKAMFAEASQIKKTFKESDLGDKTLFLERANVALSKVTYNLKETHKGTKMYDDWGEEICGCEAGRMTCGYHSLIKENSRMIEATAKYNKQKEAV